MSADEQRVASRLLTIAALAVGAWMLLLVLIGGPVLLIVEALS